MGQTAPSATKLTEREIQAIVTEYQNSIVEYNRDTLDYIDRRRQYVPNGYDIGLRDPKTVKVLKIEKGYGRHTHDRWCGPSCSTQCDDSDWIVHLGYTWLTGKWVGYTSEAIFGVIDGQASLWAD